MTSTDINATAGGNGSRYSFSRMAMYAAYFRDDIYRQFAIYGGITLGLFILASLPYATGLHFLEMFVMSIMLFLAPVVFGRERSRIADAMLPVTAPEKFTVIVLYTFVVIPLLLIGLWQLLYVCTSWTGYTYSILEMRDSKDALDGLPVNSNALLFIFSLLTDIAPTCTVLMIALSARRSIMVKSFLGIAGCMMFFFIIGAVAGLIAVMHTVANADPDTIDSMSDKEIVGPAVYGVFIAITALCLLYDIFGLWRSYRLISRKQY